MFDYGLILPVAVIITLLSLKVIMRINRTNVSGKENYIQREEPWKRPDLPEGVVTYEVTHPFLLWTLHKYAAVLEVVGKQPKIIILILKSTWRMNKMALTIISDFYWWCHRRKTKLIIVGLNTRFIDVMKQPGVYNCLCEENVVENIGEAIEQSKKQLLI